MAATDKPNILFIMSDDIGWFNVSCYNHGIMGYLTPNIDRIAAEGAMFTDFYGQQSCTAGRAAFITGQQPIRTGLTKVGMPGAKEGLSAEDPTIAQFLKNFGYATGQFGKNHLGDRNEHLPTVHGFDEFFGNLYHLNAEEEPENIDYPKDPAFRERFGPRGVLRCRATNTEDPTIDDHFGGVGKQVIEDTGPLTRERMETVDEEFLAAAIDFVERKTREGTPWFCYWNTTRMHVFTHLKPESEGKTGLGVYPDGMVELDGYIGQMLAKLDELGVADNTVVVFTTDNGAEVLSWPDGGTTPFRGEKDTNWEGGWRMPCVMRWPDVIKPGRVINDIVSLQDFIPTFAAAAGEPDLVEKVKKGYEISDQIFRVHMDGINMLPSSRANKNTAHAKDSCIGATTATSSRCGSGAGRSSSPNNATPAWRSGASLSYICDGRRSLTCAPTRSSAVTKATSTTASGQPNGPSSSTPPKPLSRNGWKASRISRHAPKPPASASTRSWNSSCRKASAPSNPVVSPRLLGQVP
jgi:arylsulfatase A-like enzyme